MGLIKFSQISGGSALQKDVAGVKADVIDVKADVVEIKSDVEDLKTKLNKNIVFVSKSIKRGESTAEIYMPFTGKCTEIIASIGTFNARGADEGPGEVRVELQSRADEAWETVSALTIGQNDMLTKQEDLEIPVTSSLMRVKVTKGEGKIVDLSVVATIKVESSAPKS